MKKIFRFYFYFLIVILLIIIPNCKKDTITPICMFRTWFYGGKNTTWTTVPDYQCKCIAYGMTLTNNITYGSNGQAIQYDQYQWQNYGNLTNKPPEIPTLVSPADDSRTKTSVTLDWSCKDSVGLSYKLFFGEDKSLLFLISSDINATFFVVNDLKKNSTYYWKVFAEYCYGVGRESDIKSFKTESDFPSVTTGVTTNITWSSAICGGNVTSDGGANVTERGVCWSTGQNPTISDNKTSNGTGSGSFTCFLTGLTPLTTYYVKAYAINSVGISYGEVLSFKTLSIVPVLITTMITSLTQTSAKCGGTITFEGETPIIVRGVCWSTNPMPSIGDNTIVDGSGAGSFISFLAGLTPNTTYYVRAYATNSNGIGYGDIMIFKTYFGTVTDIDGNVYNTVIIGTLEWMVENLKTTKFCNGVDIPNVTDNIQWSNLTTGAYCNYENIASNGNVYGRVYNYYAVTDSRKIAPNGWHVPTDFEWMQLEFGSWLDAAGKLKEVGTEHWNEPNLWATNETSFTGLPGGIRYDLSLFHNMGTMGRWWSFSQGNLYFEIYNNSNVLNRSIGHQNHGYSIRCVRNNK